MKRALVVVAFTAAACSSKFVGTGGSSSGTSSGVTASSSGDTSSSSGTSGGCTAKLYGLDGKCEPAYEASCCSEGIACSNDNACELAAYCRASCTSGAASCGCSAPDGSGYFASLDVCIRAHLPMSCWLR